MSQRDPFDPGTEVVTAPAGSGKTTLLLHHYLRHLGAHRIEKIVAITFTRKAAAELLDRLAETLRGVLSPDAERTPWQRELLGLYKDVLPSREKALESLQALDSAPVSTVDAFTLTLVQEFQLHAHFLLGNGSPIHIDGPIEGGADSTPFYEAAAREEMEALSPDARLLLEEMSLGEAIEDVAMLARHSVAADPSAGKLLDALGRAITPRIENRAEDWLDTGKSKGTERIVERAGAWIRQPQGRPPAALLALLCVMGNREAIRERDAATVQALQALEVRGSCRVEWSRCRKALEGFLDDASVERADRLRIALAALAAAARDRALRAIAREGRLGYDELLLAATTLCSDSPPDDLARRYEVLMVDELQDTNPQQLDFYRAFYAMRRDVDPIRKFFVGDSRQSIYRFRGADPCGWNRLVEDADRIGTHAPLRTNYRSSKLLVATQRAMFDALEKGGRCGVESLEEVEAGRGAEEGLLTESSSPAPVRVVTSEESVDMTPHVLAEFAMRIEERWREYKGETAAVLIRSWVEAVRAADILTVHGVQAQVTGDRTLLSSRPALDLRIFLQVLVDPTNDITMAGVLKHPSIGVSDRGLLLLREGGPFSRVFNPEVRLENLDAGEQARLERALPLLREARGRLGRESSADVLEWLVASLWWRPLIQAAPEGESDVGLAQLDILLDLVRDWESEGVDPLAVIDRLQGAADDAAADLPVVQMHRGSRVVTITTVFGAKGREFDHVALLQIERTGGSGLEDANCCGTGNPGGKRFLGVRFDPEGGLRRAWDPIAVVARALGKAEAQEEGLRLFYVGFTRAKRSVTFGLAGKAKGSFVVAVREALASSGVPPGAVAMVAPDDGKCRKPKPPERGRMGRSGTFQAAWAPTEGRVLARASSPDDAQIDFKGVVEDFRGRARVVTGGGAPPLPAIPEFADVDETVWGDVVHGWLERWGFRGEPSTEAALNYLADRWSASDPRLAEWLVALGLTLRDGLPGFRDLLSHKLHFEWPLVGADGQVIWRGRADLVVEMPGREVVILDFKAGARVAVEGDIPGLDKYAVQLHAYRKILEGAGFRVRELGLVYVRGPSWVRAVLS